MGQDLQISPSGDLQTVVGLNRSQQRVLRRLLTNQGDYIWHLDYGAGLPSYIGSPIIPASLEAVIRSQIALEPSVAQIPPPVITLQSANDTYVYVSIKYVDNDTGETNTLTLPTG